MTWALKRLVIRCGWTGSPVGSVNTAGSPASPRPMTKRSSAWHFLHNRNAISVAAWTLMVRRDLSDFGNPVTCWCLAITRLSTTRI